MESSAAVDVWKSTMSKHNLVYGTYIGDRDSSSFKNLKRSDPYNGQVTIRKEECLGHVQKRLKKRLMKKSIGSTSLSQIKANRITHLYALVVTQHRGQSALNFKPDFKFFSVTRRKYTTIVLLGKINGVITRRR